MKKILQTSIVANGLALLFIATLVLGSLSSILIKREYEVFRTSSKLYISEISHSLEELQRERGKPFRDKKWKGIALAKLEQGHLKVLYSHKSNDKIPENLLTKKKLDFKIRYIQDRKNIIAYAKVPKTENWVFLYCKKNLDFYSSLLWVALHTLLALIFATVISLCFFKKELTPLLDQVSLVYELISNKNDAEREKEKALKSSKFKSQFLAQMSHEIRTPLNSIIGMTELLSLSKEDSEKKYYTESLAYSAKTLLQLVNDILDLSKIEAGKLSIEELSFPLIQLLENSCSIMKTQASKKDLKYICDYNFPSTFSVAGDPTRIQQILINLLSNAIKFTSSGSITFSCFLENEKLYFRVKDTGIGIPKDKLKKLFQAYEQAESSTTRKFGGTGLGLSICKKLAKAMRGEIEVESTPGEGSCFTFWLPFKEGKNLKEKTQTHSVTKYLNEDFSKMKVLVVDDVKQNRDLMGAYCRKLGCHADFADNGEMAISLALQKKYDIIFMDLQMPILDGRSAMKSLSEKKYEGPVIALTAEVMRNNAKDLVQLGFHSLLPKPIKLTEFAKALGNFKKPKKETSGKSL